MHLRQLLPVIGLFACGSADGELVILQPSAELSPQALDFGEVDIRSSSAAKLQLNNTGRVPLTVSQVHLPEGFLLREGVSLPPLPPGASETLELIFAPTSTGAYGGLIEVDLGALSASASVAGVGVRRRSVALRVEPKRLDFGVVELGGRQSMPLQIQSDVPTTIDALTSPPPFFVQLELPAQIGSGVTATATFAPEQEGSYEHLVQLNGPEASAVVRLEGEGRMPNGDVFCEPSAVTLGAVPRGEVAHRSVRCRALGGSVRLERVSVSDGFSLTRPAAGPFAEGEAFELGVSFIAQGSVGAVAGSLLIAYANRATRVPLNAAVIAPSPQRTALSIQLTWDTAADLDLHGVRAGSALFDERGGDCYYATPAPNWGAPGVEDDPFLDRDDRDGYGPEEINQLVAADGPVTVYVHHFEDRGLGPANATVQVHVGGVLVAAESRAVAPGEVWSVGTF